MRKITALSRTRASHGGSLPGSEVNHCGEIRFSKANGRLVRKSVSMEDVQRRAAWPLDRDPLLANIAAKQNAL